MKQIYTKCHSFEEANALGHFIMSKGYEGVQNDSYRYCEDHIRWALEYNRRHHRDYCFVGVNGGCMVVGKNKKEMRKKFSMKYIEKERIFRKLLSKNDNYRLRGDIDGLNGVIIDGDVYLTKTNTTHKHRCSLCELDCCDGEKMHDTICANICASDEYFVKSKDLTDKINGK